MLLSMCSDVLYPEEILSEVPASPQAVSSAVVWLETYSLNTKIAFAMFMSLQKCIPCRKCREDAGNANKIPLMPPDDMIVLCHPKPEVVVFFGDQSHYLSKSTF